MNSLRTKLAKVTYLTYFSYSLWSSARGSRGRPQKLEGTTTTRLFSQRFDSSV